MPLETSTQELHHHCSPPWCWNQGQFICTECMLPLRTASFIIPSDLTFRRWGDNRKHVLKLGYYCVWFALNWLNVYFVLYTATKGRFESKKLDALNSLTTISFWRRILKHAVLALVSDGFTKLRKATRYNGECVSRHKHNNEGFIVSMVCYW
jgi:hypothetical protein